VQAVEHERALRRLEEGGKDRDGSEEYRRAQRQLADTIGQLNAATDTRGSGRSDLGVEVLRRVDAVLKQCQQDEKKGLTGKEAKASAAAGLLASHVLEPFTALRQCIKEAGRSRSPSILKGQFSKIPGLADRLADWERAWVLGRRWLSNPRVCSGLCKVVAEVKAAQSYVPGLEEVCVSCDAELFMILPRIVLVCFLVAPSAHAEFMHVHFAHRIALPPPELEEARSDAIKVDRPLKKLMDDFDDLGELVEAALGGGDEDELNEAVSQLFVRLAVAGPSSAEEGPLASLPEATRRAAAAFAKRLEHWSVELQRHCPAKWNECSGVLLKCLSEG